METKTLLLITTLGLLFQLTSAYGADICGQPTTKEYWSAGKTPATHTGLTPYKGIKTVGWPPNTVQYHLYRFTVSTACDGEVVVYAHEHGVGTGKAEEREAELEVYVDGQRICSGYDKVFGTYNFECSSEKYPKLKVSLTAGNATTIEFWRRNWRADPLPDAQDGLKLQVTFNRK